MMKNALFLLFFALLPALACSQSTTSPFPNNFNKMRLGYQTSGAGLVHTTDSLPGYTPIDRNAPVLHMDSTAGILYFWKGGIWNATAGADGNGLFSVGNNGDTVRINVAVVPNGAGFALRDVTSDVVLAINDNSVTATAGNASMQAVKSLGYLLLQGDSLVIQTNGSTGLPGQVIVATGDGGAFWGDPAGATEANNGLALSGDTVQLGGTLIKNTEVDINGKTLRFRDAAGYPDLFINGTYGILSSDVNTYLDVGSTSGRARIVAATTAQVTSAGNSDLSATDTVTITGQRIRLNAADTRIQQVAKDNALNRLMALDSLTGQLKYLDKSSISGGGTDTNFGISDITATGDRAHDFANYDLSITGIDSLSFSFAKRLSLTQNSARFLHQTGGGLGGSVFENLFLGYQAGALADVAGTGYANTVIGRRAGYNLTTVSAGGLTSSSSNTILGYGSGEALTNGTGNTFIGTAAGGNTGTGVYANTYVGWHAGLNATGSYNAFVGREAGNSATSSESTFMGYAAGYNTTGAQNAFYGANAGRVGTAHRRNAYFGHSAGEWLSSSSEENVFVGWRAGGGAANVSVGYNTIVGSEAGFSLTSGNTNTFIGRNAGKAVTSGSGNVYIGNNGGNTMTSGSNNTIIDGSGINLPSNTQSNSLLLTRDIYASGINSSIRMGIGSGTFRDPNATLHVRSFTRTTIDTIFCVSNSLSGTSPFNNFFITADGGFVSQQDAGVSVPGTPLARFIGSYANTGTSNTGWGTLSAFPTINETTLDTTWGVRISPTLTSASDFYSFLTDNNTGVGFGSIGTATNYFRGNTGIGSGTITPARTLHVGGEVRITDLTTDTPTRIVGADADGDLGQMTLGGNLTITSGILSADNTNLTLADEGNGVRIQSSTGTDVDLLEDSGVYITRSGNAAYFGKYLAYGEASITGSQTLTFAGGSTSYDTLSGYTQQAVDGFVLQGGALKYTGTRTIQVRVEVSISLTFAEAAEVLAGIRQNTTSITKSRARQKIATAGDINNISLTCLLTLAPDDLIRIELAPSAHTGDDDITVYHCNFNISEL